MQQKPLHKSICFLLIIESQSVEKAYAASLNGHNLVIFLAKKLFWKETGVNPDKNLQLSYP